MGNCNPRALFVFAYVSSLAAEACFLSVLFLEAKIGKNNSNNSCWANFESGSAEKEVRCPYFVLFLATILNGILLLYTALLLLGGLLRTTECSLRRIPVCRVLFRYGPFYTNLLTTLLIGTFIGLLIGFKSKKNFSGEIFDRHRRVYFVVVCAGFILILITSVTSGILAYRRRGRKLSDDEFDDANAINRSYSEHGGHFEDIN